MCRVLNLDGCNVVTRICRNIDGFSVRLDVSTSSVPRLRKEPFVLEYCWDTLLNMQADSSITPYFTDDDLDLLVQNLASETPIFEACSNPRSRVDWKWEVKAEEMLAEALQLHDIFSERPPTTSSSDIC